MPSHSCSPRCWPRITRPASAAARGGSSRVREPASATPSGRRRSGVTARPRPIRSTAVYRLRFITAKTSPSWSVPTLQLGLVFAVMNLSLYTPVDPIGLGLAVTPDLLRPLGVALAGSRTRLDPPRAAALAGLVILGQHLGLHEWLGIAVVVATNAVSVLATSYRSGRPAQ